MAAKAANAIISGEPRAGPLISRKQSRKAKANGRPVVHISDMDFGGSPQLSPTDEELKHYLSLVGDEAEQRARKLTDSVVAIGASPGRSDDERMLDAALGHSIPFGYTMQVKTEGTTFARDEANQRIGPDVECRIDQVFMKREVVESSWLTRWPARKEAAYKSPYYSKTVRRMATRQRSRLAMVGSPQQVYREHRFPTQPQSFKGVCWVGVTHSQSPQMWEEARSYYQRRRGKSKASRRKSGRSIHTNYAHNMQTDYRNAPTVAELCFYPEGGPGAYDRWGTPFPNGVIVKDDEVGQVLDAAHELKVTAWEQGMAIVGPATREMYFKETFPRTLKDIDEMVAQELDGQIPWGYPDNAPVSNEVIVPADYSAPAANDEAAHQSQEEYVSSKVGQEGERPDLPAAVSPPDSTHATGKPAAAVDARVVDATRLGGDPSRRKARSSSESGGSGEAAVEGEYLPRSERGPGITIDPVNAPEQTLAIMDDLIPQTESLLYDLQAAAHLAHAVLRIRGTEREGQTSGLLQSQEHTSEDLDENLGLKADIARRMDRAAYIGGGIREAMARLTYVEQYIAPRNQYRRLKLMNKRKGRARGRLIRFYRMQRLERKRQKALVRWMREIKATNQARVPAEVAAIQRIGREQRSYARHGMSHAEYGEVLARAAQEERLQQMREERWPWLDAERSRKYRLAQWWRERRRSKSDKRAAVHYWTNHIPVLMPRDRYYFSGVSRFRQFMSHVREQDIPVHNGFMRPAGMSYSRAEKSFPSAFEKRSRSRERVTREPSTKEILAVTEELRQEADYALSSYEKQPYGLSLVQKFRQDDTVLRAVLREYQLERHEDRVRNTQRPAPTKEDAPKIWVPKTMRA